MMTPEEVAAADALATQNAAALNDLLGVAERIRRVEVFRDRRNELLAMLADAGYTAAELAEFPIDLSPTEVTNAIHEWQAQH